MQQTMTDSYKLLDSAEAAAALRVSKSTLHRLVKTGKLHRSVVSTGRSLFSIEEVRRVICTPSMPLQRVG
jgi:predicted site-specific integrase-resolvase